MKHRVTVEVETKKRFLGIPYTTTEKRRMIVDGKTYRKIKKEQQRHSEGEAVLYCAAVVLEEEAADLFGE